MPRHFRIFLSSPGDVAKERACARRVIESVLPERAGIKGRATFEIVDWETLLLPGWGQAYAGSKSMMKVFIVSEALLWGSFLGFTVWSNWLENDFTAFAATHAGISTSNKPNKYFVDIGNFDDIVFRVPEIFHGSENRFVPCYTVL